VSTAEPRPFILVIEDEPKLAKLLEDYLNAAGFETRCLADGRDVAAALERQRPDLVLLDLMLPGRHGLEVFKDIRAVGNIPIVMVTALVEEVDRLVGLELGADDYICKPYSPREVVARVKAVLRRVAHAAEAAREKAHGLALDEARYEALLDGKALELTPVEFRLLKTLASRPGRIFPRSSSAGRIACAGEPRAAGRHVAVAGVGGVGAHPERIGSIVDGFTLIVIPACFG